MGAHCVCPSSTRFPWFLKVVIHGGDMWNSPAGRISRDVAADFTQGTCITNYTLVIIPLPQTKPRCSKQALDL